jgi:hypothetical protein
MQLLKHGCGIGGERRSATLGIEKDLPEGEPTFGSVRIGVLIQELLQFFVRRLGGIGKLLCQELKLLPHSPAD